MVDTKRLQNIINYWINKKGINIDDIALKIKGLDISQREQLQFMVQKYDQKLQEMFVIANTQVENEILANFIIAVQNNTYDDYLKDLSLNEKVNLLEKLEILQAQTNKLKLYKDIIYNSIDNNIKYQRKK